MHARRVDLRARPDGVERDRVGDPAARRLPGRAGMSGLPTAPADGRARDRRPGGRGLRGADDPRRLPQARDRHARRSATAETLEPANVCRVCVVEVEGARVLAPSCSRKAEAGMKVQTDSERVRLSRQVVLELLGSSVDLSTTPVAPAVPGALRRRRPSASARPPRPTRRAAARGPALHAAPDGRTAATVAQPREGRQRALRARLLEVHPLLQVRRRLRRAVPEHVRDPRRRPRVRRAHLDRVRHGAAGVGVRLLRQLHRRVPDRRADVRQRARAARVRASGTRRSRR